MAIDDIVRFTASWGVIAAIIGAGEAGSSQLTTSIAILPLRSRCRGSA
jgi:hypothetical protein